MAPASKSSMQRACAAALLHVGETVVRHPGHSNDDKAALGVIKDLGAEVVVESDSLRVKSSGVKAGKGLEVNCGESGLGLRMFAPIMGLSGETIKVRGEGSLVTRPMDFFDEVFPELGIRVVSNGGKLPLEIQGPLKPATITIDGSLSSQFLTGLLFAYAAAGARGVGIRVNNLKSKPYIDLTLNVMSAFGWEVENRNYEEFYFAGSGPAPGVVDYTVEGDWSGGAFLLVAGAVAGPITVKGLDERSTQADKAILRALKASGARMEIKNDGMVIGPAALKAFEFDATDCPDLFPPLVALAACCSGTTSIQGARRLTHKESNRALTLQEEFGKMGIEIILQDDLMLVKGGTGISGASVHSRHDHRIAMAAAVAALKADGPVSIAEAEAVNKSYPDFYDHLRQLGAKIS